MGWQERVEPGEGERFEGYATELRALQRDMAKARAQDERWRALHTKAHVGAVGVLKVAAPDGLRAGVFAAAREWPVYARFSSGAPGRAPDKVPDIRGLALKLVGVPGAKIIAPLADAATQDFLFIQAPSLGVKSPDEFMALLRAARKGKALLLPRLIGAVGFRRAFAIVRAFLSMPKVASLATARVFTAAPILIGTEAVKLALEPIDAAPLEPVKGPTKTLRDDLVARLARGPLRWRLMVQRFVDEATTPIEDPSRAWPEATAPWVEVGTLELPRQGVASARGQAIEDAVEGFSFDPWHAVPEHRPLGAVMRARAPAYRESAIERGASPEPTSVLAHDPG